MEQPEDREFGAMDRFIAVATIAISGSASSEERASAEREMNLIIEQPNALGGFLGVLREVDETVLFFVLMGIQRIVWKRWSYLSAEEKSNVGGVVITLIVEKSHVLQKFSRSKLEQVLANVCVQSSTLDPVIQVLNQSDTNSYQSIAELKNNMEETFEKLRKTITGLSALRTVLDEALNMKDPRLTPGQQQAVSNAASQMVVPAMDLACTVLNTSLSATTDIANSAAGGVQGVQAQALSAHFYASRVALETVRVIMVRIPMGDHVTVSTLDLLFAVAKLGIRGSGSFNGLVSTSDVEEVSQLAIECLHELMLKRYIPNNRGPDGNVQGSSSDMLMYLASNTLGLLQEYVTSQSGGGGLEDSTMLAPVLDLMSSFSATHLERCLTQSASGQEFVVSLMSALISVGTSAGSAGNPETLIKLASVWSDLLEMDEVRTYVVTHPPLADPMAELACHLFSSSLLSRNSTLRLEYAAELMDSSTVPEPLVDPHMRELVQDCFVGDPGASAGGGGSGGDCDDSQRGVVEGREEESSAAGALRKQVLQVLNMLASCDRVREQLGVLSMRCWDEVNAGLGISADGRTPAPAVNTSGLASDIPVVALLSLDQAFVAKVLPLHLPPSSLLVLLTSFLGSLSSARSFSQGAAQTCLWVDLCQVLCQLATSFCNTSSAQEIAHMIVTVLPVLTPPLQSACDTLIAPAPKAVTNATLVLAITVATSGRPTFEKCDGTGASGADAMVAALRGARDSFGEAVWALLQGASTSGALSLDSYALLCALTDEVAPFRASQAAIAALGEGAGTLDAAAHQQTQTQHASSAAFYRALATSAKLTTLSRLLCGLSASVKHQNMVKTAKKRALAETIESGFPVLIALAKTLFACLKFGHSLNRAADGAGSTATAASRVLGLAGSILQSLGAKTALDCTLAVSTESIAYALAEREGQAQLQGGLLYDGSLHGTGLSKAMLLLVQIIAKSSSSASNRHTQLVAQSLSLLEILASTMGSGYPASRKVVAEILRPMLDTGAVLVNCYWKRSKGGSAALQALAGGPAASSVPSGPTEPTGGEHCKKIVILLCSLSAASLSTPEVPPDDVMTSIEGASAMIQDQYLLGVPWFVAQPDAWAELLSAVVRCLLMRHHVVHLASLEELFVLLMSDMDIPKLVEEAQRQAGIIPQEQLQRLQGLCANDGTPGETSGIVQSVLDMIASTASSKGQAVSQALWAFHSQFQEERKRLHTEGPGQFVSSFGVLAASGAVKGRRSKEAKLLLASVVYPVSAEIAKIEDSSQDDDTKG